MLTNEERETHFNMTATDRSVWEVFTDDPVWIARLDKVTKAVQARGEGFVYHLPDKQVTIRKPRAPMSEKQKAKLAAQLERARSASGS